MTSPAASENPKVCAIVRAADTTPGTRAAMPWTVKIHNVGKKYHLDNVKALNDNLREDLMKFFVGMRNKRVFSRRKDDDSFWALRGINLELERGKTLGIVGRNGAGKSTLLKVLSRITYPTTGEIRYRGRLASLLEVGTGFHRQLSGRENIYLNGATLGMRRHEIDAKFDEIVHFAGTEKFLDTPIKHYSSGMTVRLAFAVAAHLRTDILIVDEVLAVGDAQFQKRCLGKMKDAATDGRTVLFVSHNMAAVRQLCELGIHLDAGEIAFSSGIEETVDHYLSQLSRVNDIKGVQGIIESLPEDPEFRMLDFSVGQDGKNTLQLLDSEPIRIFSRYEVKREIYGFRFFFDLCDENDEILVRSFNDEHLTERETTLPGVYEVNAEIPGGLLAPRSYTLRVQATVYNVRSFLPEALRVDLDVSRARAINVAYPDEPIRAKIQPNIRWKTDRVG